MTAYMNLPITKRQKEMLSIIYKYIKDTGYPPTFEEMRQRLKVKSNQSVLDLLKKLQEKKLIKRNESGARSLVILPFGYNVLGKPPLVPFLGLTTAGAPVIPIEISGEWQKISQDAALLREEVFLLKIHGDSMINAGIDDGDVVLVKSEKEFVSGHIVLADIDGEKTIKRFVSDDNPPYIYLKPENPKYSVIPATDRMCLIGRVISILKNGSWISIT